MDSQVKVENINGRNLVKDHDGKELGNLVGMCAEPKAAQAAHKNNSHITGMDTRWRLDSKPNPHPLEGGVP